ncbi:helix-turn-helix domain-containing protein [Paludibaculum fermentans]|uniref:helix-turn-helix domain-containing protein n=1 Tax=Paludibaculum fermentans TaxID=1473598 RepID=UPI003EB9B092
MSVPCGALLTMAQIRSYQDWYRDGPLSTAPQHQRTLVPQEDRVFQAGPVQLINVSPPAGAVMEPPVPEYALNLLLRSAPLLRVGFNRRPRWLAVSPGSMVLTPPDTYCEFVADAPAHVLAVTMHKAVVEEFAEASGRRVLVRQEEAFRDPRVSDLVMKLWMALSEDAPGHLLYADQTLRELLMALAARGGERGPSRHGREQLANHTVRRLQDYVESSLAEELDVPVLAQVAGLSPAHFARAFAATVGMTPFRYVMARRLAHAREMLQRTRRSALDIALDAGFKTPSHFTARFRQEFGVTPREMRGDGRLVRGLEL